MLDVVRRRRSIRRYEKRDIPADVIAQLKEALRVLCMVSIGYPAEQKPPVPAEKLARDKILCG